jgi:hypothetical protein
MTSLFEDEILGLLSKYDVKLCVWRRDKSESEQSAHLPNRRYVTVVEAFPFMVSDCKLIRKIGSPRFYLELTRKPPRSG